MARTNKKHNIVFINGRPHRYYVAPPDPDFLAIMNYADAEGFDPPTNLGAFEALIKDLKAIGMWGVLDIFYLFSGDGDSGFKSVNLVNPGQFDAQYEGGIESGFSNEGLDGGGSGCYVDTGFAVNSVGYNWREGHACKGGVVSKARKQDYLAGTTTSSFYEAFRFGLEGQRLLGVTLGSYDLVAAPGLKAITRIGDLGSFFNVDDVQAITYKDTHSTYPDTILTHRQFNRYTTDNTTISCFFLGGYLTDEQMLDFRDVFNEYLNAIGEDEFA